MPVYERTYTSWDGEPTSIGTRFAVISAEAFRAAIRSKIVWLLLTVTVVHVAIRAAVLYFTGQLNPGIGGSLPPDAAEQIEFSATFIADAINFQARWVLMVLLALVAAPSLSRDLRAGALQFYFSKPITRSGYAAGKLLPPVALGLLVTAVPALILWLVGMAFTPETLRPDGAWLMPVTILVGSTIATVVASMIVVALSGIVRSTNLAAATWVAAALVSAAAAQLMVGLTGRRATLLVDVFGSLGKVVETTLGVTGSRVPGDGAWLVTIGLAAAAFAGLWYVLRDPEVGA